MSVGWLCIYFYVRVSKGDKILTLTPDNDHHFISSDKNIFIERHRQGQDAGQETLIGVA